MGEANFALPEEDWLQAIIAARMTSSGNTMTGSARTHNKNLNRPGNAVSDHEQHARLSALHSEGKEKLRALKSAQMKI